MCVAGSHCNCIHSASPVRERQIKGDESVCLVLTNQLPHCQKRQKNGHMITIEGDLNQAKPIAAEIEKCLLAKYVKKKKKLLLLMSTNTNVWTTLNKR